MQSKFQVEVLLCASIFFGGTVNPKLSAVPLSWCFVKTVEKGRGD